MHKRVLLLMVFFLNLVLTGGCGAERTNNGKIAAPIASGNGIVGGDVVADEKNQPSVFLLQGRMLDPKTQKMVTSSCTAVLISKLVALTAAHCTIGVTQLQALFGLRGLDRAIPSQDIPPENIISHPQFSPTAAIGNDLALVKINSLPDGMSPATLPWNSPELQKLLSVTPLLSFEAVGYGDLGDVENFSMDGRAYLRAVNQKMASYTSAKDSFLVDQTNGKGICKGDSGGPALVPTSDPGSTLIGIASQVFGNPKDNSPKKDRCEFLSLYTNVAYYQNWIVTSLKQLEVNP